MNFVERFKPRLDRIRTNIPSNIGVRSATLTVRTTQLIGDAMTGGSVVTQDKAITGPDGGRYKVNELSTKDVVSSGGLFQSGSLRVGPITPPYPGGAWTKTDLLPASVANQEVYYGVTDQTGITQWCSMASSDTVNDLHWYIVLNPTGTAPNAPPP